MSANKSCDSLCGICRLSPGKYKCSSCRIFKYCSVNCYKEHQNSCTNPINNIINTSKNNENTPGTVSTSQNELVSSPVDNGRVSDVILESFHNNSSILSQLQHPELQSIITHIDTSTQREAGLERYYNSNSDFRKFVDEVIEVIQKNGK
jgi:hypothetical protein